MEGTHSPLKSSGPTGWLNIKAFHTSPTQASNNKPPGACILERGGSLCLLLGTIFPRLIQAREDGIQGWSDSHEGNGA